MPLAQILLDTNAYLRLAKTIRPLLGQPFGDPPSVLSVIPEINQELEGHRLSSRFPWTDAPEHREEREFAPQLSRAKIRSINATQEFLWEYVVRELPGPSRVDVAYVAHAIELNCQLVTDDQAMAALAQEHQVETLTTLQLLHLMLECGHISMSTVRAAAGYWRYTQDLPANYHKDYRALFGEDPP